MAQFDLALPRFGPGDLDDEKQRRRIMNYLVKLDEQLRFVLNNLDTENFTETFQQVIIGGGSGGSGADIESIRKLEGELGRLSTQITQTANQIALKASAEELNELGDVVTRLETSITETANAIVLKADKTTVDELGDTVSKHSAQFEVTAEQIRLAVQSVEIGGRNLLTKTRTMENASSDLALWQTVSAHSRAEDEDGFYRVGWKVTGLTEDVQTALRSPLFRLPDGWLGRKAALSFWVKAEDWETLDGGMEARICLTTGDRAENYRWVRLKLLGAGGAADGDLSGARPVNGQWRRVWATAELSQEGLNGSGAIELPETVTENEAFRITKQPVNADGQLNGRVYFTVEAVGAAAYQWQYRTADGVTWYDWAGQTTETMTLRLTSEGRLTNVYRCKLTDADGNELYTNEVLAYEPETAFEIIRQPESADGQLNGTVYFTVEAAGAGTYQWQYRTPNGTKWTNWSGQTTATMTLNLTTAARVENLYRCEIRDVNGRIFVTDTVMVRKPLADATHGWAGVYVSGNADFSLKAPQLEFGDRPSDWSPAPEDVDGELTKLQSELLVQADEIALRVKQETLDAAIDGVQVGGRNLLRNTAELKKANYSFNNSSDASANIGFGSVAEDEYGGFHVVCNNQNVRIEMGEYPVTPGQTYAMSARYKINSGSAPIQFQYIFRDGSNVNLYYWSSANQGTTSTSIEDGWTVLKSVFTVPSNSAIKIMSLKMRTGADNTAYTCDYNIRRPKFEAGSRATDWTPAPEDGELAVKKLEAELSVQAGKISANTTAVQTAQDTANAAKTQAETNKTGLSGVTTRVTTAEVNISALDEKISTKVEKSEFDDLGNQVAANTASITTTATEIRSEVADSVTGLQTQIDQTDEQVLILAGKSVGGTNMLKNTAELKKANYSFNASGASAMGSCTEDEFGGFHIVCSSANVRWQVAELPVSPGQSYVMSVQYRMNSGSAPIQFQYVFRNSAGTALNYWDSINHSQVGTRVEDGWTVLTSVFTVPDNDQIKELRLAVRTGADYGLYTCDYNIRRPKFESGSMPTAWSPSPEDPAGSVNAGGVVRVDQTGVHLSGGVVEMETSDGDEFIHITNSGISASSLEAPNVAKRYAGPAAVIVNPDATSAQIAGGGYFRSLPEAFSAVSNRYLEKNVTITVQGDTYGDALLTGVNGSGSVTVHGGGYGLIGTMTIRDCGIRVYLTGLAVSQPSASTATRAVCITNARYVAMESSVKISGNGGSYALLIDSASAAWLHGVELYNAENLMYCIYDTHVTCLNLKGGGGTYFAWANGCLLKMAGTRPDGSLRTSNAALLVPTDPTTLQVDYGTAQPSVPVVQTATYSYLYSDSHVGGWGYFDNDDIYQGFVRTSDAGDTAAAYGVIWFDQAAIKAALNGKTINQASLRLHMHSGVGRGSAVSVQLYGTSTAYTGRSGAPALTASYGDIGSTNPGETAEITIPAQAVSDLVSGTICALVLKSDDTELYKDRDYSRNYARFSGTGSATADNCPRLTVVYQ